jgi:hypothetical protein
MLEAMQPGIVARLQSHLDKPGLAIRQALDDTTMPSASELDPTFRGDLSL